MDFKRYTLIDQIFFKEAQKLQEFSYLWPLNEKEEKKRFLRSQNYWPRFHYRKLAYDPDKLERNLASLKIPDDRLGRIFEKKRKFLLLSNKILKNRGSSVKVRKNSIKLYGFPKKDLVAGAQEILRKRFPGKVERLAIAGKVKKRLEKTLTGYGLDDWSVELSDKRLTTVYPLQKKITVGRKARFDRLAPSRLAIHEVGVHVLRAANGYRQPFKIFVMGLPGYLATEEGLALYFEEKEKLLNPIKKRSYAGRVLAVEAAYRGLGFIQAFARLKKYRFTDEEAWNLATRAYRGGGYIKDHLYLQGFLKIKKFVRKGGNLKMLFLGKIGIEDLPLVEDLLQEKVLKRAKYLPMVE